MATLEESVVLPNTWWALSLMARRSTGKILSFGGRSISLGGDQIFFFHMHEAHHILESNLLYSKSAGQRACCHPFPVQGPRVKSDGALQALTPPSKNGNQSWLVASTVFSLWACLVPGCSPDSSPEWPLLRPSTRKQPHCRAFGNRWWGLLGQVHYGWNCFCSPVGPHTCFNAFSKMEEGTERENSFGKLTLNEERFYPKSR